MNLCLIIGGDDLEIYLDIVVLENFIIDAFLIKITSKIIRTSVTMKRLLIASLIGGIYTITFCIPLLKVFSTILFQIGVAYFIIAVSFQNYGIKAKIKAVGVFLLLSIVLSGMCYLLVLLQCNFEIASNFFVVENSVKNIIISLVLLYFLGDRIVSYFRERTLISNFRYEIEVEVNNLRYNIKGFLDTGNELREPITNLPCILIEEGLIHDFKKTNQNIYLIPYCAIGVKGNLEGIKVDKVMIRREGERWREVKAIICPCSEVFSRDREFNALLSRGIV